MVAEMWSGQNESVSASWFSQTKFNAIGVAAIASDMAVQEWRANMSFFQSPDCAKYDGQLFNAFEAVRRKY